MIISQKLFDKTVLKSAEIMKQLFYVISIELGYRGHDV